MRVLLLQIRLEYGFGKRCEEKEECREGRGLWLYIDDHWKLRLLVCIYSKAIWFDSGNVRGDCEAKWVLRRS